MRELVLLVLVALAAAVVPDSAASLVLGQASYGAALPNRGRAGPGPDTLFEPYGVSFARNGDLFVCDSLNNRVLVFAGAAGFTFPVNASFVYGQPNMTTGIVQSATSASTTGQPTATIETPDGMVMVSDDAGDRMIVFPAGQTIGSVVYGQSDFTSDDLGSARGEFDDPRGVVFLDDSTFFVADRDNNRIQGFRVGQSLPFYLFGQAAWGDNLPNQGGQVGAGTLHRPAGLCKSPFSKHLLYICDQENHRVLVVNTSVAAIGGEAIQVFGQANLTSNVTFTSRSGMESPAGCAFDIDGNLYVADSSSDRVTVYPPTLQNGPEAISVYGQTDYDSSGSDVGQDRLRDPRDVAVDAAGNVWIADNENHRVVRYGQRRLSTASGGSFTSPTLLDGSVITSQNLIVASTLNITGDVQGTGSIQIDAGGALNVGGTLFIQNQLTVAPGGTLSVAGGITVGPDAILAPQVESVPAGAASVTVVIATYAGPAQGSFASVVTPPDQACASFSNPTQNFASGTLSSTIQVQDTCSLSTTTSGNGVSGNGLSTGAIIGIAVGAALGGIAAAIIIGLCVRAERRRRTIEFNKSIRLNGPNGI